MTYGPDRVIDFVYEDRSDPVSHFRGAAERIDPVLTGGVHTETSRRLKTIQMRAGTQLLRQYTLSYDQAFISRRSQLRSVTECDGAEPAVCMNALEFDWSSGSNTFHFVNTDVTDAAVEAWDKRYFIPGDINGDGRDDSLYRNRNGFWMMRFSTGEAFTFAQFSGIPSVCSDCDARVRPIDFDRDGRMDVMVEIPDDVFNITWFALYRSTGSTYEHVFTDSASFHKNLATDSSMDCGAASLRTSTETVYPTM